MPTVNVSDVTYAKLQRAAKPFIDTEDSTCSRVLDFYLEHNAGLPGSNGALSTNVNGSSAAAVRLDPDSGRLAHTKLISATVDGTSLHRPKWNSVMNDMHI